MKQNITVAVDKGLLKKARAIAAQRGASVSALLADELLNANKDWYRFTIEQFGPDRCMFESNFPVDKISGSYAVYWNAFKRLASGASPADKAALFRDTARKFYRLP